MYNNTVMKTIDVYYNVRRTFRIEAESAADLLAKCPDHTIEDADRIEAWFDGDELDTALLSDAMQNQIIELDTGDGDTFDADDDELNMEMGG